MNKSCELFKSCCSLHKHCSLQTSLCLFKGQGSSLNKKAVYKLVCYLWCILGSELPSDVSITDELEMKNFYNVNVCLIV